MRIISTVAQTLIASGRPLAMVVLVEMHFATGSIYMNSGNMDIDWNNKTWVGMAGLGRISSVDDVAGGLAPMTFALAAAEQQAVAMALETPVQGQSVSAHLMLMNPDDYNILDVQQIWTGTMDQMTYNEDFSGSPVTAPEITVTAEHRGVTMKQPYPLRYTDNDQRRVGNGDAALQYVVAQSQVQVVWPAASFFKQ